MNIDIPRLSTLLDHGSDKIAAGETSRGARQEAEQTLRSHADQNAVLEARVAHCRQTRAVPATLAAEQALRSHADQREALEARVTRRRAEEAVASSRANNWRAYCNGLRALAQKHGVAL